MWVSSRSTVCFCTVQRWVWIMCPGTVPSLSTSFAKPHVSSFRSTWSLEVLWNRVQDCQRSHMLFKSIPEKHLLWAREEPLNLCCLYSFHSQECITGWELAMWETTKSWYAFGMCTLTFVFLDRHLISMSLALLTLHVTANIYTKPLTKNLNEKIFPLAQNVNRFIWVLALSIWKFQIFSPYKCFLLLSHRKRNCYEIEVFPNIQLSEISNAFVMAGQYLVPQLSCLSPSCGGYGIDEVANFLHNWCQLLL